MRTLTKDMQEKITPAAALDLLREGNKRFVGNLQAHRNLLEQVNETYEGQHPFAVVLSCIDSRTSAELIFDQGLGDIFSIRLAGSVINEDVLGCMEFGCAVAGAKLIVVLGHTKCGAIQGACDHVEMGNLTSLVSKIAPAVYNEKTVEHDRNATNEAFVTKVTEINVRRSVSAILNRSLILKEMLDKKQIGIVGGMHDLASGEVRFFDDMAL
jgi:carbonic anhydrase